MTFSMVARCEDTNSVGNFTTGTVGRVTLGQEWDGAIPSDFYNGKLDEVSFFNSEISASDVTTISPPSVGVIGTSPELVKTTAPSRPLGVVRLTNSPTFRCSSSTGIN